MGAGLGIEKTHCRGDIAQVPADRQTQLALKQLNARLGWDGDAERLHRYQVLGSNAVRAVGAVSSAGEALEVATGVAVTEDPRLSEVRRYIVRGPLGKQIALEQIDEAG
jgi:hypothetical protein